MKKISSYVLVLNRDVDVIHPPSKKTKTKNKTTTTHDYLLVILFQVTFGTVGTYMRFGGWLNVTLFVLGILAYVALQTMGNLWLTEWTEDAPVNGTAVPEKTKMRLGVYGAYGVGQGEKLSYNNTLYCYSSPQPHLAVYMV